MPGSHGLAIVAPVNSMGFTFIAFEGYDLIATEEIKEPEGATDEMRRQADNWISKTLTRLEVEIEVERKLIEASSVACGIAKESRDYDLVVLGAAREPFLHQVMFGEIPQKVARHSPASVLVVKRYEGHMRSWLKRTLG